MAAGTDGDWASDGLLEFQAKMYRSQSFQMVRTKVADVPLVPIIFVGRQTVLKVRQCAPSEFAGLIDAALSQRFLDQLLRLSCLVIVMAGKNHGGNGGPVLRCI